MRRLVFCVIAALGVLTPTIAVPLTTSAVASATRQPDATQGSADFAVVYQRAKPSVVYVVCATASGAVSGSGFVFRSGLSSSQIITANHVVEGSSAVDVIFDGDAKQRYAARIVKRDHIRDVAFLEVDAPNRTPLALANIADVQEGMSVAVIGFPRAATSFKEIMGDDLRPSVHRGIVSAIRLNAEIVQFDAITDHGDSGGPVIDARTGRVIGIVHGSLLDPSYARRGLENPLPGSTYAMSTLTIQNALVGSAESKGTAAVGAPAATSGSTTSSASFRVGMGIPTYTDSTTDTVSHAVLDRLVTHFRSTNAFYVVPVSFGTSEQESDRVAGACDDLRLHAIMEPTLRWNLKGSQVPGYYDNRVAEVWVALKVTDCSGAPFYWQQKTKWERREFANRDAATEVVDMSNDMLDRLISDFDAFTTAHQNMWTNLLKTGILTDPSDGKYHALYYAYVTKDGVWHVGAVYPGGPAAIAGLKSGDIIQSIDGRDTTGLKVDDFTQTFNQASYKVIVKRPEGIVTLELQPKKYEDLQNMVAH